MDFVKENPQLIEEFLDQYDWHKKESLYSQENLINSAEDLLNRDIEEYTFSKKSKKTLIFGDEQGNLIGQVFDYILRDGGESKNFTWMMGEMLR